MATKIFEGVVERTSQGTVTNGVSTMYEFIEIGGQRVRKVQADNFLDSFINPGDSITISCEKGLGAGHRVLAVKEPNGSISKAAMVPLVVTVVVMFGCALLLLALPLVFLFAVMDPALVIGLWLGCGVLVSWAVTRGSFKARNALDGIAHKATTTAL